MGQQVYKKLPSNNKQSRKILLFCPLLGIVQIQLEQDSGKSLHDTHEEKSLIDLNRLVFYFYHYNTFSNSW